MQSLGDNVNVESVSLMRRRSTTVSARLAACLFLAAGVACSKKEAPPPPPPEVQVAEVVQKDVPIYIELVGATLGSQDIEIRSRVEGYLVSMDFIEGSFVKKAQLEAFDAKLAKARLDLNYTSITSPIDGLIGTTQKKVGSQVGRNESTPLTTVSQVNQILFRCAIAEAEYLRLA